MYGKYRTIGALLLCCAMLLTGIGAAYAAESADSPAMELTVPAENVMLGETFLLTLELQGNPGYQRLEVNLVYDHTLMEPALDSQGNWPITAAGADAQISSKISGSAQEGSIDWIEARLPQVCTENGVVLTVPMRALPAGAGKTIPVTAVGPRIWDSANNMHTMPESPNAVSVQGFGMLSITGSQGAVPPGGQVTVAVNYRNHTGISGYQFLLEYDRSVLSAGETDVKPGAEGSILSVNPDYVAKNDPMLAPLPQGVTPGNTYLFVGSYGDTPLYEASTAPLFTVTFTVLPGAAPGSVPVKLHVIEAGKLVITPEGAAIDCPLQLVGTQGSVRIGTPSTPAEVDAKITAIGQVTLEREPAILDARNAYNSLSDADKKQVTKLDTLQIAEAQLQALKAPINIRGATMVLGNELSMNFYIRGNHITDLTGLSAVIRKTSAQSGETVTTVIPADQWTKAGSMYRCTFQDIAAKEMTDQITVQIHRAAGGTQVPAGNLHEDSVEKYGLRSVRAADASPYEKAMAVDMLNYGAAAQLYFGYAVDRLANEQLTADELAMGAADTGATDHRIKGDNYVGTSLTLDNRIRLNMYFRNIDRSMHASVVYQNHLDEKVTHTIPGSEFMERDTLLGVQVKSLVVADARRLVSVQVLDANGQVIASASDSLEGFVARASEPAELDSAIMRFSVSAYNFFQNR